VSADDPRPTYAQVADHLRSAITSGELRSGQRIPSQKQLAKEFGVSAMTVHAAVRQLREEGVLVSSQGRGVFVSDAAAPPGPSVEFQAIMKHLDAVRGDLRAIDERLAQVEAIVQPEEQHTRRRRRADARG
jgi:DNA-binding GntR family transcriptional regulator